MLGNFTDIIVLLDRSGSMNRTAPATRESFNAFLASQREVAGSARLTLVQFSGPADFSYTFDNLPLEAASGLTEYNYRAIGGSTALRLAMGKLISSVGQKYAALPEASRPSKVIFVVITDAQDNASGYQWPAAQLRELVERQTERYSWQFVYLGAGHDAITAAAEYGIGYDYTLNYASTVSGITSTGSLLSDKVSLCRSVPEYKVSFTAEERAKAEDK